MKYLLVIVYLLLCLLIPMQAVNAENSRNVYFPRTVITGDAAFVEQVSFVLKVVAYNGFGRLADEITLIRQAEPNEWAGQVGWIDGTIVSFDFSNCNECWGMAWLETAIIHEAAHLELREHGYPSCGAEAERFADWMTFMYTFPSERTWEIRDTTGWDKNAGCR
jgi:hypothetical protein